MHAERTAVFRFRGVNRAGANIVGAGRNGEDSATLAERLFDQGFRRATIFDSAYREVGGVGPFVENQQRTWWGVRDG